MNDTCIFCNTGKVNFFSSRAKDGYFCKECEKHISMFVNLEESGTNGIKSLIEFNRKRQKDFTVTSSLGALYIDSLHRKICLSKKCLGENNPLSKADIYRITDFKSVAMYCTNVRNIGKGTDNIICDIEFSFTTDYLKGKLTLLRNEVCNYTYKEHNKIEYSEPVRLGMFRNIFNQMIEDEKFNFEKKIDDIRQLERNVKKAESEEEWARGVLMLEKDYDLKTVKEHRNALIRALHPDTSNIDIEYSQKVNKAFKILNEQLK